MGYVKGQSGNPGGLTHSMRKARGLAREVIGKLFAEATATGEPFEVYLWRWWLNHDDPNVRAKGFARARDEFYGSPMMRAELSGPDGSPLMDSTSEERRARIRHLLSLTGAPPPAPEEPNDGSVN